MTKVNTCSCCREIWSSISLNVITLGSHKLYLCPDCYKEYKDSVAKRTRMIYISHPFTGDEEKNKEEAFAIAAGLAHKYPDTLFVNPLAVMEHTVLAGLTYETVLDQCLALLDRCDGIIMTGSWKQSRGCKAEHELAMRESKPVWYGANDFEGYREESNEKE